MPCSRKLPRKCPEHTHRACALTGQRRMHMHHKIISQTLVAGAVACRASSSIVEPICLALFSTMEITCCMFYPLNFRRRRRSHPLILRPTGTTSRNQRSHTRRNEASFESLAHKDSLPLQDFLKTRPSHGRTDSAESILRLEDRKNSAVGHMRQKW